MNTSVILQSFVKKKVRLPSAVVHINDNGEFLTIVVNLNAIQKMMNQSEIQIEQFQSISINSFNNFQNNDYVCRN